jgi:selenocysteine lyase/cysteine desulfurase
MSRFIPCQRHLFQIPGDVTYLNCGYMSPLLRSVQRAGEAGVNRKRSPWTIEGKDFSEGPQQLRTLFAQLIGASASDIAIIPAVSYGVAVAAANLQVEAGQNIVLLEQEYPSNVYAWAKLARRVGATVRMVPCLADSDWTASVLAAIDHNTALASLSNCHFTDGRLVNLVAVGKALRQVGARLVVDGTQSIGVLPFDVREVQPDFVVCASYKWLFGPYGLSLMYVAPRNQQGQPIEDNPGGREFSFESGWLRQFCHSNHPYHPDARRFDQGQADVFTAIPQAIAALEQILLWGVETIQATLSALTEPVWQRATDLGLSCVPTRLRAGHFAGLRFPKGIPDDLLDYLRQQKVYVERIDDILRVSPHLYNTEADIDQLFAILASQRSKIWNKKILLRKMSSVGSTQSTRRKV